jgi:hypothetical protein
MWQLSCSNRVMRCLLLVFATTTVLLAQKPAGEEPNVKDVVRKSVAASERNWKEAPNYAYSVREVEEKIDSHGRVKSKVIKTYQVMMLDGSEYKRLIKENGHALPADEQEDEQQKLDAERARREHESQGERSKRIAKYNKERQQDRLMMHEMTDAFNYTLVGRETVDGHPCYVLNATPKPGYVPKTRDTKVLTGMRGKMWVDQQTFQWVKVEAEVMRPVSFYAVASVGPGTKFILEQEPVGDGVWLPKHFAVKVNASILFLSRNSSEDESYWNYHRVGEEAARVKHPAAQAAR